MSGGYFNYDQYKIGYIADEVEDIIEKNFKEREKSELDRWDLEYLQDHPGTKFYHNEYPPEVIAEMHKGLIYLRLAFIYAQRIDWLESSDEGEESFLRRLKEDKAAMYAAMQEKYKDKRMKNLQTKIDDETERV